MYYLINKGEKALVVGSFSVVSEGVDRQHQ